jgi:predicted amidohydrolase YtcJ
VLGALGVNPLDFLGDESAIWAFGRLAARVGVTTATDLGASIAHEDAIGPLQRATSDPAFPLRVVLLVNQMGMTAEAAVDMAQRLRPLSTEMLRMGFVKIHLDGSIQGFTARVGWPGYYNGAPNGLWYNPPDLVKDVYVRALRAGLTVHAHTNGDEATELALDMIEAALHEVPRADHRFTLQHAQLATAAQFRRMRALGVGVNLFANHTFYWGDQHRTLTVGPERAERMNACASALAHGVPIAIHSDSPVTPMNPLFSAWCAVNRITASGRTHGEHERISVAEALHAVTLGPAYSLHLDHEVGSIECGKRADFCVLEEDPMSVDPMGLRDIRVLGTVQGGRVFGDG